VTMAIV